MDDKFVRKAIWRRYQELNGGDVGEKGLTGLLRQMAAILLGVTKKTTQKSFTMRIKKACEDREAINIGEVCLFIYLFSLKWFYITTSSVFIVHYSMVI